VGPITRSEESYRVWRVCDREVWLPRSCCAMRGGGGGGGLNVTPLTDNKRNQV